MADKEQQAVLKRLHSIVEPVLADLELELVELIYRPEQHGWVVRILIYSPAGIGLDECAKVSREVSTILDVEDFIPHHFSLEVSSPGLDRPLKTGRDFERNLGAMVKLTLLDGDELIRCDMAIKAVAGDEITMANKDEELTFSISELKKAKLII